MKKLNGIKIDNWEVCLRLFCIIALFAGLGGLCYFWYFVCHHNIVLTPDGQTPDFEKITGPIGDFVGGVFGTLFSFASALLVVYTIYLQNRQHAKDTFSQTFYEMLHIHNDNVKSMTMHWQNDQVHGRKVFSILVEEYARTYNLINTYVKGIRVGAANHEDNASAMMDYVQDDLKTKRFMMRLAYGYFFFGSEKYILYKHEKDQSTQQKTEVAIANFIKKSMNENSLYVVGKNVLLGHYYRHLYQMVKYLITSDILSEQERYQYAKLIRAQLNDDEQLLLYHNAMADTGSNWLKRPNATCKMTIQTMCPMARFRIIKNMPMQSEYYGVEPHIQFEEELKVYKKKGLYFFEMDEE